MATRNTTGEPDFDLWKQRMQKAAAAKEKKSSFNWLKIDNGQRVTLRFLPVKGADGGFPIVDHHYHSVNYPDGKFEAIVCPQKTAGDPCPFCEYASSQWQLFKKTEDPAYKELFKRMAAKHEYLAVAYDTKSIDPANPTPEDVKIVKISSQANKDIFESKMSKGVSFASFAVGREVELSKSKPSGKNTFPLMTFDFGDPEPAFDGPNGQAVWESIVEVSPDLTPLITPLSYDELQKKFKQMLTAPMVTDPVDDDRSLIMEETLRSASKTVTPVVSDASDAALDIAALQAAMDDD